MLSILFVGGSGHWAEKHYYPALLQLRREGFQFKLAAICDINDPYKLKSDHFLIGQKNLEQFLRDDKPLWCCADRKNDALTIDKLDRLHQKNPIKLVFITCDSQWHYLYATWAINNNINVICEKPPFLVNNVSSNISSVNRLINQYESTNKLLEIKHQENPNFIFCVPLKCRQLLPYAYIGLGLSDVFQKTGQGLSYLNIMNNNGLHRYPIEFMNDGAHGYANGIGSLSHSPYHYLDIISWYIHCAKGKISRLGLSIPFVLRVRDYLNTRGYESLAKLLQVNSFNNTNVNFSKSLLNVELDFLLNINLYDEKNNQLGLISYHSNHMSFNPRTLPCNPNILEPGNHKQGGKMKQMIMDVHQGALQNFFFLRNHENIEEKTISVTRRLHPSLGKKYEHKVYSRDLYLPKLAPIDVLRNVFKFSLGQNIEQSYKDIFSTWRKETLTYQLFSQSYKLIAEQANNHNTREVFIELSK